MVNPGDHTSWGWSKRRYLVSIYSQVKSEQRGKSEGSLKVESIIPYILFLQIYSSEHVEEDIC